MKTSTIDAEKTAKRMKWAEYKRNYRQRKKLLQSVKPPTKTQAKKNLQSTESAPENFIPSENRKVLQPTTPNSFVLNPDNISQLKQHSEQVHYEHSQPIQSFSCETSNSCRACGKALNIFEENKLKIKGQIEHVSGGMVPNKVGFPSCICTGCQIITDNKPSNDHLEIEGPHHRQVKVEQELDINDEYFSTSTKPANIYLGVEYSQLQQVKVETELDIEDDGCFEDFSKSTNELVVQYVNDETTEQTMEQNRNIPTKSRQNAINLNSEHPEAAYICNQCGKYFSNKSNLQLHQLRHTGIKDFACEHCDQKFYTPSLLKIHARKHTNPFKCTYCDESFGYNSSRKRHERLHRNERPFKCPHCDKSFNCSKGLKEHENTHLRIRSFVCKSCSVWFMSSKHLKAHYRTKSHIKTVMNDQRLGIDELT